MNRLKMAIPKGKLYDEVVRILADAGMRISQDARNYRPVCEDKDIEVKLLKTQNIPKLVELGSQDIAFTGYDWVLEQDATVKRIMDLGFNPVRIVAATPKGAILNGKVRVASEYEKIARDYLKEKVYDYQLIKSFGATEVFAPEDADMIIDNTSTGSTLKANELEIVDTILETSTVMIANSEALKDDWKENKIRNIMDLLQGVLEARKRILVEMNVSAKNLKGLVQILPCMKSPTIAKLYGDDGYAVKVAVKKEEVRSLVPLLKEKGASDILVFELQKVIQ